MEDDARSALAPYFAERLWLASEDQGVALAPATTAYLADFVAAAGGPPERTLAELRSEAILAAPREAPRRWRETGEAALLLSGVFVGALARRHVSRGYCVAMGASAYGVLGATAPDSGIRGVYGRLADDFDVVADVLAEVGDTETDDRVVRVYRAWRATGSPRLERRLRGWGIALTPLDATG